MRSPAELTELLREKGLKVTAQRQCIFRILHGASFHPTAEQVYQAARAEMSTISLRTVYQTLNDLVAMGEIGQIDVGTGSTQFDPNLEGHHHLVCVECGTIRDLHAEFPAVRVPSGLEHGFQVSATEIVFRGRCADCAAKPPVKSFHPAHR